jgi:hypothetical protein
MRCVVPSLAVAVLAVTASSAQAQVRGEPPFAGSAKCMTNAQSIEADMIFVGNLRAKGVSCATAKKIVKKTKRSTKGGAKLKGYSCRAVGTPGKDPDGLFFRCSRGKTTLQFYFGV